MSGEYWRQIEELRKQEKAKAKQEETRQEFQSPELEKKRKEQAQREQSDLMREIEKQKRFITPIVNIIYPILNDIRNNDPQIRSSSESKLTSDFVGLNRRGEIRAFVTLYWGKFGLTPYEKKLVDKYGRLRVFSVFGGKNHPETITKHDVSSFSVVASVSEVLLGQDPLSGYQTKFDVNDFLNDPSIILPGISSLLTNPRREHEYLYKGSQYASGGTAFFSGR